MGSTKLENLKDAVTNSSWTPIFQSLFSARFLIRSLDSSNEMYAFGGGS